MDQNDISITSIRLKNSRLKKKMSLQTLSQLTGYSKSVLQRYENGDIKKLPIDRLKVIASVLGVDPEWLFGDDEKDNDNVIPITGMVPVFGSIPAGVPAFADQYIEDYIPTVLKNPDEYFCLRVKGRSMINAGIPDGARVMLHKQSTADNGQIVACRVNNDEATLKRFRQDGGTVILMPENPEFSPIILTVDQFADGYAEILGVVRQILIDVS